MSLVGLFSCNLIISPSRIFVRLLSALEDLQVFYRSIRLRYSNEYDPITRKS